MRQPRLTKANYYADKYYWSASFVKEMLACPARALAGLSGEYEREASTALLVGSYVDAYFDGKLMYRRFASEHPEIFNSRTGELKKDFVQANEMIARAQQDTVFMSYIKGQRQKILTGTIDGIPFRCKMDFYIKGTRIVDLKTVKDFDPVFREGDGRISFADYWRWPLQMAIYQELVRQNTGDVLPCYLACISKQTPPDILLVEIPQYTLDAEMEVLKEKLPYLDAMRQGVVEPERCCKCAYCRSSRKITEPVSLDDLAEF